MFLKSSETLSDPENFFYMYAQHSLPEMQYLIVLKVETLTILQDKEGGWASLHGKLPPIIIDKKQI